MHNFEFQAACASAEGNLHHTAGVASGDYPGSAGDDVLHLAVEQLAGHFLVRDVIDPRASTAPVGLFQIDQLEAGDAFEQLARLLLNLLPVSQMAGIMV